MESFTHTTAEPPPRELRFAHLTIYDVFGDPARADVNGLVPAYRQRLRQRMLADLREVDTPREEMLSYLSGFNKEPVGLETFIEMIDTPTGAHEVVAYAHAKANNGQAIEPELPPADLSTVFWALVKPLGIQRREPGETTDAAADPAPTGTNGDGGGGDPANPPAPLTYSATPSVTEPGIVGGTGTGTAV